MAFALTVPLWVIIWPPVNLSAGSPGANWVVLIEQAILHRQAPYMLSRSTCWLAMAPSIALSPSKWPAARGQVLSA